MGLKRYYKQRQKLILLMSNALDVPIDDILDSLRDVYTKNEAKQSPDGPLGNPVSERVSERVSEGVDKAKNSVSLTVDKTGGGSVVKSVTSQSGTRLSLVEYGRTTWSEYLSAFTSLLRKDPVLEELYFEEVIFQWS